ncbi:hypothetical protein QQ045_023799 [Rhodiola kirilowii]
MEGRPPIPQSQRRLKFQDKVNAQERNYERYAGLSHIERRIIANRSSDDPKTLRNIHPCSAVDMRMDVNEHERCTSHLPGYLGHSDRGGSLQDKALNVGVLNWDHIDKRNHNQRGVGAVETGRHDTSSTKSNSWSSLASKLYYESYSPPTKQKTSFFSNHSITSRVGFAPGEPNRERIVCLLSPQKPISDVPTKLPRTERSSSRNYSQLHPSREEPKRGSSLNLKDEKHHNNSKAKMPVGVYETKNVLNMLQRSRTKNLTQTELYSEIRRTISSIKSIESPEMPKVPTITDHRMEDKVRKQPSSSAKLNDELCPQKHKNNVVLLSGDAHPKASGDFLVPESQVSADRISGSNWNSSSDMLSEGNLSNHLSGISQSSPQHHHYDSDGDTSVDSKTHPNDIHNITVIPKESDIFSFTNDSKLESPDYACVQGKEQISEHREFSFRGSSLRSDQVYLDQPAPNSRNPSPLRHLSYGFSRMRKSLSSKDSSVIAPSNSKRFPRSVGVHSIPVDTLVDKAEVPKKARSSSPLRRLIDPILKPKVAIVSPYVDEHIGPIRGTKMLDNASVVAARSSQTEKKKKDTVQALLQYSTKNGLPMFKFVAKKKGDALVATMVNTSALEKQNLSLNFTLYSVNEMTKNSSWMYQGRTGKNCGYLYNIVGQMKLCVPSSDETTDASSSKFSSAVECTLVGVQPSKADQETMKVKPNGELAALVIKTPNDDSFRIKENSNNNEKFLKKFCEYLSDDSLRNMAASCKRLSASVILPAGVHSMPNKGAPSPLLHRWRSGGSCDCGGWDVGCNISLLHSENGKECCEPAEQSKDSPIPECFQLFSQTGVHGKDPVFKLTPFSKGIYSVDFKPSTMSDLQAFFISITVLSSLVTFDLEA